MKIKAQGVSMIELLIALGLGLYLTSITISLTLNSFKSARQIELTGQVFESGRYLLALLNRELDLAGFYGQISYMAEGTEAMVDLCAGLTAGNLAQHLAFPIQGLNNAAANTSACGGDRLLPGSDLLLIRRVADEAIPPSSGLLQSQHYIQASPSHLIADTGAHPAHFSLAQADAISAVPVRAFQPTLYYVSEDGNFKRRRFLKGRWSPAEPLVESVDDFQLLYGIDRSGKGIANALETAQAFVDYPSSDDEWRRVVAVEFYLLLSSGDAAPGALGTKTYSYAGKHEVRFKDNKKRRLFKGLSGLVNIRPRPKELPHAL